MRSAESPAPQTNEIEPNNAARLPRQAKGARRLDARQPAMKAWAAMRVCDARRWRRQSSHDRYFDMTAEKHVV